MLIAASFPPTFERFTARARAVLVAADNSARSLGRGHVHPEHLLLGLFAAPEGIAARVLAAMSVSEAAAVAALAQAADTAPPPTAAGLAPDLADPQPPAVAGTGTGTGTGTAAARRLPYSPEAAAVLRDAVAEALERGHNYIGTEHILLGLLRDADAPAAAMLAQLGASSAEIRVRISEMLRGFRTEG
ncbi:MAG: Clp protease N-terminal domain-containing protein [Streptosporangiaceae bacterium]